MVYQANDVIQLVVGIVDGTGQFSINIGIVIEKEFDDDSVGLDYMNEATVLGKDLNADLFAIGVVKTPTSELTLNINALASVVYHRAVELAENNAITLEHSGNVDETPNS